MKFFHVEFDMLVGEDYDYRPELLLKEAVAHARGVGLEVKNVKVDDYSSKDCPYCGLKGGH